MTLPNDLAPEGAPEGTGGEPEVGGSQVGDDALSALGSAQSNLPPEVAAWLEKASPSSIPEGIRKKWLPELEKPLIADFTRRNQSLAEKERSLETRQQQLLDFATQALAKQGVAPTPSQADLLREKIQSGELDAIPDLVSAMISERVAPAVNNLKANSIIQNAQNEFPILREPEVASHVQQTLSSNPTLQNMARVGDLEGMTYVLRGLALEQTVPRITKELTELKASLPAREKAAAEKAVAEYKQKVLGIPATTSRAGSTPRGTTEAGEYDFRRAFDETWEEMVGKS